ncbi:unnamed protein product, partial [Mesorhabditis spiculigera]
MASIVSSLCLLLVFCLSVEAVFLPNLYQPNEDGMAGAAEKRMSRQALIRLMIQRDRQALGAHGPIKRSNTYLTKYLFTQSMPLYEVSGTALLKPSGKLRGGSGLIWKWTDGASMPPTTSRIASCPRCSA